MRQRRKKKDENSDEKQLDGKEARITRIRGLVHRDEKK